MTDHERPEEIEPGSQDAAHDPARPEPAGTPSDETPPDQAAPAPTLSDEAPKGEDAASAQPAPAVEPSPAEEASSPGPPLSLEAEPPPPAASAWRPGTRRGLVRTIVTWVLIVVFVIPPAWVAIYRFVPPPVTPLMLIRLGQGKGLDYRWRPLSRISPALVQAAVAAEDARFCTHHGFDFEAMRKAWAHNERRPGRVRGGSTISQQTAKNVFLWPGRSLLRKGVEAYFTVLIEALWGKRRIMETYLNVVEMGPGIYGAEAAANRYFKTDAAGLSNLEASRLAAILPSPLKWKAASPGPYVQRRSRRIGGAIGTVREDGLAACIGRLSGRVPAAAPDLSAPPPPSAEGFVRQQAAEDAPPAPPDSAAAPPSQPLALSPAPQSAGAAADALPPAAEGGGAEGPAAAQDAPGR